MFVYPELIFTPEDEQFEPENDALEDDFPQVKPPFFLVEPWQSEATHLDLAPLISHQTMCSLGDVLVGKLCVCVCNFFSLDLRFVVGEVLLMAEILHHLGCMKPYK